MITWPEPQRLADEQPRDRPTELAAAIREARARQPRASDVEALATRLQSQLTAANEQAAALPVSVGLGTATRWLATMLIVTGVATYATVSWWGPHVQSKHAPVAPATPRTVAPRAVDAPRAIAPESPTPAAPVVAPSVAPAASTRPAAARTSRATRPAADALQPRAAKANPEAELALLERAHAALASSPTAALALAEQHRVAYASGLFAQEREVIAIEALLALSRKPAAIVRAREFLAKYPTSAHARRVRPLLERAESTTNSAGTDHP